MGAVEVVVGDFERISGGKKDAVPALPIVVLSVKSVEKCFEINRDSNLSIFSLSISFLISFTLLTILIEFSLEDSKENDSSENNDSSKGGIVVEELVMVVIEAVEDFDDLLFTEGDGELGIVDLGTFSLNSNSFAVSFSKYIDNQMCFELETTRTRQGWLEIATI